MGILPTVYAAQCCCLLWSCPWDLRVPLECEACNKELGNRWAHTRGRLQKTLINLLTSAWEFPIHSLNKPKRQQGDSEGQWWIELWSNDRSQSTTEHYFFFSDTNKHKTSHKSTPLHSCKCFWLNWMIKKKDYLKTMLNLGLLEKKLKWYQNWETFNPVLSTGMIL